MGLGGSFSGQSRSVLPGHHPRPGQHPLHGGADARRVPGPQPLEGAPVHPDRLAALTVDHAGWPAQALS